MLAEIRIHAELQRQLATGLLSPTCYPEDSIPAELLYCLCDLRCVANPRLLLFVTHLGTAFVRERGFDCAVSSAEDGSVWLAIHASSLCEVTHNIATGVARHLPRLARVLAGEELNATIYSDRGTYQIHFEEKQPCTPILNQPGELTCESLLRTKTQKYQHTAAPERRALTSTPQISSKPRNR